MTEKKTTFVQIRTTPEQKAEIKKLADEIGVSVSELLLEAVGRVRPWTAADKAIERERTRELARIGNNLNQIARWANTHKSQADGLQVIRHLVEIERAVKQCISST